jgi:signal transduction histidine kinase
MTDAIPDPSWSAPVPSPRGRDIAADALLALVVGAGAAVMDVAGRDHRPSSSAWWTLALVLPLVGRRRSPLLTVGLVGAGALVQWQWGPPVMGDVAVLIALYSLASNDRRRWLLAAVVVGAETGVVLAVTRWSPGDTVLPVLMLTGTVTAAWVAGIYARTRRDWRAALEERAETAERERDSRARVAVAAERVRIARELHDVVAHSLSVMITLNDAAATVDPAGPAHDLAEQASDVGRGALEEMRHLVHVLRGSATDDLDNSPQPTAGQLNDLASLVRSAGPSVELRTSGDLARVPASLQLAVYRIVQEGLTNVLKHGRNVSTVTVLATLGTDRIELEVINDGDAVTDGGPRVVTEGTRGLGLVGMRERAAVFGGTVRAGPQPRGGWRVAATLLMTDRAASPLRTAAPIVAARPGA